MIKIYSLKMERELNERERQQALDILTPERKAKALRFRRLEDQSRGLATGVLEIYALWKEFGIPWSELKILKGEQGKPYLMEYPDAWYNLSHSGAWIVCGTGEQPIGIDVEQSEKYSERIVRRFFHPEETDDIFSRPEQERAEVFAEYWTMKESFMKFCGMGFSLPLSCFSAERDTGRLRLLPTMKEDIKLQLQKQGIQEDNLPICQLVELETGYKCAVCTMDLQEIEMQSVTFHSCLEELVRSNHHQSE